MHMAHLDPVCGMTVEEAEAAASHEHDGVTYYFCNPGCLERFTDDPAKFLNPADSTPAPVAFVAWPQPGIQYTCPMHPEVVRDRPGPCPLCGMALEPRTVAPTDAPNPELVDMTRRFRLAALLAAPHGAVDTYFDTAVVITVLVLLGQVLELRARSRTNTALRQLLGLIPKTARVVRDGEERDAPERASAGGGGAGCCAGTRAGRATR
jgi:YHS domain-containing protein